MEGLEDYDGEVVQLIEEKILTIKTAMDIQAVIMSISAIFGVCGCIYVIWLIFMSKCRSITNYYSINRLLSDLLLLLSVPFIVTQTVSRSWPFGNFLCKVSVATTHACGLASCSLLAAFSISCYCTAAGCWDRFARLFWFRFFTALTWVSAIIYAIPHLVLFGAVEFQTPYHTETHCTMTHAWSASFYLQIINILMVAIPMLISGAMAIAISLVSTSRMGLSEVAAEARSGKKLMVVLTLMFVIWLLPFVLGNIVHHVMRSYDEDMIIALFLMMPFPFVCAALDPFIYLRYKGDLLKPQQSETSYPEPTVALLASEQDSLAVQFI